jgi:hypothetical protein
VTQLRDATFQDTYRFALWLEVAFNAIVEVSSYPEERYEDAIIRMSRQAAEQVMRRDPANEGLYAHWPGGYTNLVVQAQTVAMNVRWGLCNEVVDTAEFIHGLAIDGVGEERVRFAMNALNDAARTIQEGQILEGMPTQIIHFFKGLGLIL